MANEEFVGFKCSAQHKAALQAMAGRGRQMSAWLKRQIETEARRAGLWSEVIDGRARVVNRERSLSDGRNTRRRR